MRLSLVSLLVLSATACSDDGAPDEPDYHASGEHVEDVASLLVATDPVSAMVTGPCSTKPIEPLATQLIQEVNCLSPGAFTSIKNLAGTKVSTGQFVFPYLQTFAVTKLKQVIAARGTTMSLNSGLRSLPEQFVLYRWYETGRCGITLAATPGTSNHESGLAVDIEDNAGWRSYFLAKGWHWQGASDPVHYDIAGGVNMKGLSVRAFQRLWNRNHPTDTLTEDGVYGPATAAKITVSPIGGFPLGATCSATDAGAKDAGAKKDGGSDGGDEDDGEDPSAPAGSPGSTSTTDGGDGGLDDAPAADAGGCSSAPASGSGSAGGALLALGLVVARLRAAARAAAARSPRPRSRGRAPRRPS